jgi:nucleoside-diphosphate-sugar epimerase
VLHFFIHHDLFNRGISIAKILITGANGFVGSHVLQTLMAIQHDDLEIVAACRDKSKLIPSYRGEVRVGDLRDPEYLDRLLINIDIICHTAGWTSFTGDRKNSTKHYLEPTIELINHAIEWRVSRFVNLSSLAAAPLSQRHNPVAAGQPRSYWPMMNCLIAVEDYLKAHAQIGCSMVNLRLGIYSGQRINIGLLPLLIDRMSTSRISYPYGPYGYFPLVDGKDIGQAFARAALAPNLGQYESFNIIGPDQPPTSDVLDFLQQQIPSHKTALPVPAIISHCHAWLQEYFKTSANDALFSRSLSSLISNPLINIESSKTRLGFDPEISWQASLYKLLEDRRKQDLASTLCAPVKPLNLTE